MEIAYTWSIMSRQRVVLRNLIHFLMSLFVCEVFIISVYAEYALQISLIILTYLAYIGNRVNRFPDDFIISVCFVISKAFLFQKWGDNTNLCNSLSNLMLIVQSWRIFLNWNLKYTLEQIAHWIFTITTVSI